MTVIKSENPMWRKRNNDWVVQAPTGHKQGDVITVYKRSGESQTVKCDRLVETVDGYDFWYVTKCDKNGKSTEREVCAECGKPGKLVADLEDGILKHYKCCDIPPSGRYR